MCGDVSIYNVIARAGRAAGQAAVGAAALAAGGAVLWATFADRPARQAPEASGPAAVASPWVDAPDAARRFVVGDPRFGREPDLYSVRRHAAGGGRLDQMAFGSPGGSGRYLRLSFYRPLDEPVGGVSFWLEMARRAGEAGLALERAPSAPTILRTRLGAFEFGALKAVAAGGARDCYGFRHQAPGPELVVSGIACFGDGGDGASAGHAVACVLESLRLAGADDDAGLRAFFEGSEEAVCSGRRAAPAGG